MIEPSRRGIELFVEGHYGADLVARLLARANFDMDRIAVVPAADLRAIREALSSGQSADPRTRVALVDTVGRTVPDARERARRELGHPNAEVFCAVPSVDAWLFSDLKALSECVGHEPARELIDRLPLPEEIPYPGELVEKLFPNPSASLCVADQMDVSVASARSPSLHAFLQGLAAITGTPISLPDDVHSRSVGRDTFSNLIAEIIPAESVIYRTIDGSYTAGEMIREVRDGTELGRQYSSDLLRISRDFLARQAQRESQR